MNGSCLRGGYASGILALLLCTGTVTGHTALLAQDEQATEAAESSAEQTTRIAAPELVPVELISWARFESDLAELRSVEQLVTGLVGHAEWRNDNLLFSVLSEISLEKVLARSDSRTLRVLYELHVVIPQQGVRDYGLAVTVALPRSVFSEDLIDIDLSELVADSEGFATSADDAELLYLLDGETVYLLSAEEWMDTDRRQILRSLQEDFRRHPPRAAFDIVLTPQKIRPSLRKPFVDMVIATLSTSIQKRDQEDELQFRTRELWGKTVVEFVDVVANQVQSIHYTLNNRSSARGVEVSLTVKARKGTHLDAWLNRQSRGRSGVVRYLHPSAVCSGMINIALPEVWQETWPPLTAAAADVLRKAGMISLSAAREISVAVSNIVDFGRLELLCQVVPDHTGQYCFLLCIPLRESPDFSNAAIELVSMLDDGNLKVAYADIDGWPLHQYALPGEGWIAGANTLQMIVTDDAAMISLGPPTITQLMEAVVRREFDSPPEREQWTRRGLAMHWNLVPLMQILELADEEETRQSFVGPLDLQTVSAQDDITVLLHQEPQQLEITAAFDEYASPFAAYVYGFLFEMLMEGL